MFTKETAGEPTPFPRTSEKKLERGGCIVVEERKRRQAAAPYPHLQSRRDCVTQPRVARNELPWVKRPMIHNPNGVVAWFYFQEMSMMTPFNKSMRATRDGVSGFVSRFTSLCPACLSSGGWA